MEHAQKRERLPGLKLNKNKRGGWGGGGCAAPPPPQFANAMLAAWVWLIRFEASLPGLKIEKRGRGGRGKELKGGGGLRAS